jgi:hypothetical protein
LSDRADVYPCINRRDPIGSEPASFSAHNLIAAST